MNTRGKQQVENDGRGHAVVLGGSLAGLLAARVLAEHFEKVTLIERDAYPETTAARRGIPPKVLFRVLLQTISHPPATAGGPDSGAIKKEAR